MHANGMESFFWYSTLSFLAFVDLGIQGAERHVGRVASPGCGRARSLRTAIGRRGSRPSRRGAIARCLSSADATLRRAPTRSASWAAMPGPDLRQRELAVAALRVLGSDELRAPALHVDDVPLEYEAVVARRILPIDVVDLPVVELDREDVAVGGAHHATAGGDHGLDGLAALEPVDADAEDLRGARVDPVDDDRVVAGKLREDPGLDGGERSHSMDAHEQGLQTVVGARDSAWFPK